MQNYKRAHAKIQGCVEVDVESEHNESLFKLTPDSEMSLRQTVSQCIDKALGIMNKISDDPIPYYSAHKSPTTEGKLDNLYSILEKVDNKLGPEFREDIEECDLIDKILSKTKEPLVLQYPEKYRLAEIIIGSMRNKQEENDRVLTVAEKLKHSRMKLRVCEAQI